MPIFRNKKQRNYTVIDNRPLRNEKLSWKAKGLLSYLLSLPQDWDLHLSELESHATDGETSLRSGINELREAGYIIYRKARNEKGHFEHQYLVFEHPQNPQNPNTENRDSGNPDSDNGKLLSTNEQSTDQQSTYTTNPRGEDTGKGLFRINTALMERLGGTYNKTQLERLLAFAEDDGMEIDMIEHAIELTAQKKREGGLQNPLMYAEAILKRWRQQEIKTMEKVKEQEGDDGGKIDRDDFLNQFSDER